MRSSYVVCLDVFPPPASPSTQRQGRSRWLRTKKQPDNYCRPCRAAYHREHYEANRQRYIDQARRRKEEVRASNYELLIQFLRSHPCVDCGEDDALVLEFDHVAEKSFQITAAITYRAWSDIMVEIAKCDVVCANCHRRRTAQRGGWARFVAIQEPDDPAV